MLSVTEDVSQAKFEVMKNVVIIQRIHYIYVCCEVSDIKCTLVGIASRRCSNYIFVLHLTLGPRRETLRALGFGAPYIKDSTVFITRKTTRKHQANLRIYTGHIVPLTYWYIACILNAKTLIGNLWHPPKPLDPCSNPPIGWRQVIHWLAISYF